jgi:uncharacterized protein (TIGR02444 family)
MQRSRSDLEADSWAFALGIYAKPGVAEACLKLQNEAGVDVMLLLNAVFMAVRLGILLAPAEIRDLDAVCRPWREQIVQPLRAVRGMLKTGPLPAPSGATEPFRSSIMAAELAAERLQNQLLADRLPLRAPNCAALKQGQLRELLHSIVMQAQHGNGPTAAIAAAIEIIVTAAMSK